MYSGLLVGALGGIANTEAQTSTLVSGIELENRSTTIGPGDDFYEYVNERWLKTTEIPADQSNYGAFTVLDERTKEAIRTIIEQSGSSGNSASPLERQVGNFYKSYTNLAARNAAGIRPIQPLIDLVINAKTKSDLARVAGQLNRRGVGSLVGFYIEPDAKKSDEYGVYIAQSGITLPDRDFYLVKDDRYTKILAEFEKFVADMLQAAGQPHPQESAKAIVDLERRVAQVQWTKVELREPTKTYNKTSPADFAKTLSNFDWPNYSAAVGIPERMELIVGQPSYFAGMNTIVAETPLEVLQAYHVFRIMNTFSGVLTEDLDKRHFQFHSTVLRGVTDQKPLWRRGVEACNASLGMPVGQLYVAKHFSPVAKQRMLQLVDNLKTAFSQRIDTLDWMSQATKQQAKDKLSLFTTKIGYPDKWKDYSSVETIDDQIVENLSRIANFEHEYELNKIGKPIDRTEWSMTPQMINAYYHPLLNEIAFPAAILQPPFFNLAADDAANYGAIGAVIGHELSHGFDDKGSKYDGHGNLRNWWTASDREQFENRAKQLVAQYSKYQPLEGMSLNGELTLGENIGDLGGLAIAYHAYQLSLDGKPAPVIDGLTGDQRFFMGWSQIWRRKYREPELRNRLLTDPHSPSQYRVIGIVSNMDAFYTAFNIKPGDKMYIPPEQRVRIW